MNWNLFWGLYTLAFAVATFIIAYALGWRSIRKEQRCSAVTHGVVIRYSMTEYNGIHLPVVRYIVNGREYTVVGPKFKASVTKSSRTPWNPVIAEQQTNIRPNEPLPDVIKINRKSNSFASVGFSPLMNRYPIGAPAYVYYDPRKPKVAYVERYAGTMLVFSFWIPLIAGIILTGLGIFFLFGPTLIMQ